MPVDRLAYSRPVTALSNPRLQPLRVFPVSFAAPRIVVAVGCRRSRRRPALRRPPDPPGVEEDRLGAVEAPEIVRAGAAEVAEDVRPLDEERALLLEERLERGQVDDRRIDFDLAEVGIDRAVERQVAADPVLEVDAGPAKPRAPSLNGSPALAARRTRRG